MPNLTTQNVTGIFNLDTSRLVGLAPKGVGDPTFVPSRDIAGVGMTLPPVASLSSLNATYPASLYPSDFANVAGALYFSDGANWNPAGTGGGGGTTFTYNATYGWAEAVVSGLTYVALPTDGAGNVKGNVTPRTGTYSALIGLSGGNGELSSPTDQVGVIKHTGAAGGAQFVGNQIVIDASTLTVSDKTRTIQPGVSRIVVAWVASQTGTAPSCDLVFASNFQIGQSIEIEYVPRGFGDAFIVNLPGYSALSLTSVLRAKVTIGANSDVVTSDSTYIQLDPSVGGSIIGGGKNTTATGPNSLAVGPDSFASNGGIGLGSAAPAPACDATFYASVLSLGGTMCTGKILLMKETVTAGAPMRLVPGGQSGTTQPAAASIFGNYRVTLIAMNTAGTSRSKLVRDFDIVGGAVVNITTPVADIQGTGVTASIANPALDGSNNINITATSSATGIMYAILEFNVLG